MSAHHLQYFRVFVS